MVLGALIVVAVVFVARRHRPGSDARLSIITGAAAVTGAFLVVIGGSEDATNELLLGNLSKLGLFFRVMRMLPAVPIFGCGRGAFESAFPAFRTDVGHFTYTHPENVVAQWVLEWGVPMGVLGLGALAFALRPNAVIVRSTSAAGAWAALVALGVQNLGDLGTEIPGLVLAAVLCGAIVVGGTHGREPKRTIEQWARVPRRVAVAACLAAAGGIALASTGLGHELREDRLALHDAALVQHVPAAEMRDRARTAMLRHPAEPYLPFVTALRASYAHDDNAIPWIGATLERASVYAPAHLVLARVLAQQSPSQARLEYRLAAEQMPEFASLVMTDAPRLVHRYSDAEQLVPQDSTGAAVIELLVEAIKDRLPSTCTRLDADLAERVPSAPGPALRVARDAVRDLESESDTPWCQGAARVSCVKRALDAATRAEQLAPNKCDGYVLRARARMASGDVNGGLTELEVATDRVSSRVACLQELVAVARDAHDEQRAHATLNRIANAGCGSRTECAANLCWVAGEEEGMGNPRLALAMYRRAYENVPDDDNVLEQMARLAAAVGLHAEAADDYRELGRRHPQDARWRQAAEAERGAAVRAAARL
jgi:tetratricopeptide (TPR) repeat protein